MKVQPLSRLLPVLGLSACAAFLASPKAAPLLKPYVALDNKALFMLGYAAVFTAAFTALTFIASRITISIKARGLETAKGPAPIAARLFLALAVFTLPLFFAVNAPQKGVSLQTLITAADTKKDGENGYNDGARTQLGALLDKGHTND